MGAFTLLNAFKCFLLVGLGQMLVMAAVYFTNGQLLPSMLSGIYAKTGFMARLVLALATALLAANLIIARAFSLYPPSLAAPISIFCVVLVQVFYAVLIFRLQAGLWLYIATLACAASCVWVSLLMNQKAP